MASRNGLPDVVPQLSRGKHRSPRKGACFMEMASYLAGERWSDRPPCTHPLLAALARLVNDHTSDAARTELAPLVPSVIGLRTDDPRVDVRIALRAAIAALPVASAERQRVLAVSVLTAGRALSQAGGSDPLMEGEARTALEAAPAATAWATRFIEEMRASSRGFGRHAAPSTVRYAVVGIAAACVEDPDVRLRRLLRDAIDDTALFVDARSGVPGDVDEDRWLAACRLTGVAAG
ncbi:MAG TPA: hypothetical protein VFW63_09585 [Acidimicrobiales bacterium]|nr:hypothetical protein [Acidimicrobiales bacterium]